MLIPAIIALAAVIMLAVALRHLSKASVPSYGERRKLRTAIVAALILSFVASVLNFGGYVQGLTGANLHLPATVETKSQQWIKAHQPPKPAEVAQNMKMVADGVEFYRDNHKQFSADEQKRFEDYAKMPTKIDHVLSLAEEANYYRAAQDIYAMISRLAGHSAPSQ